MTRVSLKATQAPTESLDQLGLGSRAITAMTVAAVFLSPYTTWRLIPGTLFTFSDALFCLVALLFFASGRHSITPFADLWPLWLRALGLMMLGLLLGSAVNGDLTRWLIVAGQYCCSR